MKIEQRLPETEGRRNVTLFTENSDSVWDCDKILKMDSGDDYTNLKYA